MPDDIGADASSIFAYAADLTGLADLVPKEVQKSVQQTGLEGKKFWTADARKAAGRRTRGYAGSIDFDLTGVGTVGGEGTYSGEIGPNLDRGGKTGSGGLQPSLGILEGPVPGGGRDSITRTAKFVETELEKRVGIAIEQSERARNV
ncbi:hypothetical protein [Herbiconiux solani]|uniref:hypothetical protein n=1 Tax=Herbiconiux solani TaxID=661329 RepID=UPI00082598A0|nr:hypothetical protein [Herbiconiux solani]